MLLAGLKEQGVSGGMALSLARLDRIEDNTAYICFSAAGETFARTWNTNGKRDQIRELLTRIRGIPTGVQFEVDSASEPAANGADGAAASAAEAAGESAQPMAGRSPATVPPRFARAAPEPQPQPQAEPEVASIPVTAELVAQLRNEPLLAAVLDELNGQVVKVVEL